VKAEIPEQIGGARPKTRSTLWYKGIGNRWTAEQTTTENLALEE